MDSDMGIVGLGDKHYRLGILIGNRPPFMGLPTLNDCQPLVNQEIQAIGQACGNGWRKVFNLYAKLMWALKQAGHSNGAVACMQPWDSWQSYRDEQLLQSGSGTALLFEPPCLAVPERLHIIMGRSWAKTLLADARLTADFDWLSAEFAIDRRRRLLVCPYFDYRQLSDIKLDYLVSLLMDV